MSWLKQILNWDYNAFKHVNVMWHNSFFDLILPITRNPYIWAPLYLFIGTFMYLKFGKNGLIWSLFFLITFAIGDFVSASIIKPIIHRVRPCNEAMWIDSIRLLVRKSHGWSFPSSHATNHFALATFSIITLKPYFKNMVYLSLLWAAVIAYAQVYVGVHYPIDVMAGALLGLWAGHITGNYFNLRFKL
jgi:membrane-associated phospholipid phosphatase